MQENVIRFNPSARDGLTQKQVETRIGQGLINAEQTKITKSNFSIFKDNVLTLFNLFNLIIGVCLAFVGAYMNMAYLVIILLNISIGIIQEVHARNLVNKLSLLSAQKAKVIRDGKETEISVYELVLDDIVALESGNQVSSDAVVLDGEIEVNESLLTGEADAVQKSNGDGLLSGSFIVSGRCKARVDKVGADNFISQLASGAKKHKKINSELLRSMRKVTKFTGFLIIPIGVLLFVEAFFIRSEILSDSVVSSAAALLGMLPKGLVLLISIALSAGVIKLSQKKVLVQEMHAIETLAHVDVLCLDKTGTITEGKMEVSGFFAVDNGALPFSAEKAVKMFIAHSDDGNATFNALKEYFQPDNSLNFAAKIPFSSDRKWSAVYFKNMGTVVLGAPEKLSASGHVPKALLNIGGSDKRLLYAGFCKEKITDGALPELTIFAAIELSDKVRENAKETIAFFHREGVAVKIISGDSPVTASCIAKEAGIENYGAYIDMTALETKEEIENAAAKYSVFGRVSPMQKKDLIAAFKAQKHTVAMAGDGVNDVLALREADCGIALSCGCDATKQVSQLVLTDSDFTSLPDVIMEGRRVVNNITKVAGIFFIKTLYSVLLSVLFIVLNLPFPFMPIQITLIDLAIEAYPSLFMSFERDSARIKRSFLSSAVYSALPFAILIFINTVVLVFIGRFTQIDQGEITALMYLITGFISIIAVFKACMPFNKLRLFLAVTSGVGFFVAVYLFSSVLNILKLTLPSSGNLWIFALLAGISLILSIIFFIYKKLDKKKHS